MPKYRVPFFDALVATLAAEGVDCTVAAGLPLGAQALRGDSTPLNSWEVRFQPRRLSVGGHTIDLGGSKSIWKASDATIVGLQGTLLDTYLALARRHSGMRVGVWGHVKSYVNDSHPLDLRIESWQARTADRVFAYTPGGADEAAQMGVSRSKITTVMNSVDTTALLEFAHDLSKEKLNTVRRMHGLVDGKTFCFVGGIDSSKRIHLLADALEMLWLEDPEIKLLLAGDGADLSLMNPAITRGQVIQVGYANDAKIAELAALSNAMVMPGRIGLVAVQSLALGLPIATTEYEYHAPEFEYLQDGVSVLKSASDPKSYANLLLSLTSKSTKVAPETWEFPRLEAMVRNFATGVLSMLQ